MPEHQAHLLRVAAARADFLENGRDGAAGVSDVLAASWVRSREAGVDVTQPATDFTEEIDTGSRLVRCAQPVLQHLGEDTADLPLVIALTDHRARVVRRLDSSSAVGRLLDRVHFAPGFNYAEGAMGTNGVGTVIETGRAFSVIGPEHFAEHLQPFACTGAPIIDPLSGRLEGILDISALSATWSPLMHTLVKSAAKDIGRNLLLDRSQAQQALFDMYLRADARSTRHAVFAFAESVFMANGTAQTLFDATEQLAIRERATFLTEHRDRAQDTFALPSGRAVRISGTRIVSGTDTAGIVVVAEPLAAAPPISSSDPAPATDGFVDEIVRQVIGVGAETRSLTNGLRRPHEPIAGGVSPSWVRACTDLREALSAGRATIVLGETGSGKFSLTTELFHADHPCGRSLAIDAAQVQSGAPENLTTLHALSRERTLCIVRNIDQAGTEGVDRLDALFTQITSFGSGTALVATLSDSSLDSDLPFHALLGHFEVAVTIPPLRCRTEDLPLIVNRLLVEAAPNRRVRLSPEARRTIARYSWPRNVTQLREALEHALRARPVGEIQEQDLPGYCRTRSRRTLTRIESAELDAILAALEEHGGNRVAAAHHLGMSRSTLYRKLRAYGVRG